MHNAFSRAVRKLPQQSLLLNQSFQQFKTQTSLVYNSAASLTSTARNLHPRSVKHRATKASLAGISKSKPSFGTNPITPTSLNSNASRNNLQSNMYGRRVSVALASVLVGYGAYYSSQSGNQTATASLVNKGATNAAQAAGALPTRQVLIIGADELSTGTFVGEGPISKTIGDNTQAVIEILDSEQTDAKLRNLEESYLVNRGEGVVRYDLAQVPSNNPIEDDHAEKIVNVPGKLTETSAPNSDWMFWGVFDGHSGWSTSAKLRQSLIVTVARELNATYSAAPDYNPSAESIDKAIKDGFLLLDDEIVNKSVEKVFAKDSKGVAAEVLAPALSGSCALLSFYDSRTGMLRVACTGDSRAVLGRRNQKGLWTATALSADQTGSNPDEEARLRKEHPNEPRVIYAGRVLGGLEPTRAFGDASYKWTSQTISKLKEKFFARSSPMLSRTPPYVTAEPVVTTTKVQPENGDFMVMATDGLWEMLTNEEVVGLVGKWIDANGPPAPGAAKPVSESIWNKLVGRSNGKLPVDKSEIETAADGSKTPVRVAQWNMASDDSRFVVQDKNVATHLLRNALGGKNAEQVSALLTLPAPFSRRYRDDVTVQVVFFGNGPQGQNTMGEVVLNVEASRPMKEDANPKL
ncbi:protein phosphatase 2C [Ceratocystis lukuohia]